MAKRNSNTGRRTNNYSPRQFSYSYRLEQQSFRPFRSLHSRPPSSRPVRQPVTPPTSDYRTYHPLGEARPLQSYLGRPTYSKRLVDPPRSSLKTIRVSKNAPRQIARAVQKRLAQFNRFGPDLDRATRAVRVFSDPLSIPLCRARRARREVLHALGVAGGGKGAVKRPRRTERSEISCA